MILLDDTTALDEAFERLSAAAFELPNGFVNHGAMAVEALAAMGYDKLLDDWARRFSRAAGAGVRPVAAADLDPAAALGDMRRLPELIGTFERAIADDGWDTVVARWVPQLMPALRTALFHGAIRTAHAVRAISEADTAPRRAELARALGYWAARWEPGAPATATSAALRAGVDDVRAAVLAAAADGARHYLASPGIVELHGVTGAMAVELLVPHLPEADGLDALAQVRAEHAALYRGITPVTDPAPAGIEPATLADDAANSRDPHQVKLVEACRRGSAATGDPAFAAAAEVVTA